MTPRLAPVLLAGLLLSACGSGPSCEDAYDLRLRVEKYTAESLAASLEEINGAKYQALEEARSRAMDDLAEAEYQCEREGKGK